MVATQQILYICTHTAIPHSYTYPVSTKPHILLFTYLFPCSNTSLHIPVAIKSQIPINTSLSPSYTFYTYLLLRSYTNPVAMHLYISYTYPLPRSNTFQHIICWNVLLHDIYIIACCHATTHISHRPLLHISIHIRLSTATHTHYLTSTHSYKNQL